MKPRRRVFVFGDTHFPFHNKKALRLAVKKRLEAFCPDVVIQLGDLYDFFSFSRFARSQNIITPYDEIDQGRIYAEEFWEQVDDNAPQAKKIQITGNHDIRPLLRSLEKAPELEFFVKDKLDSLFTFDGVRTIMDPREELIIDDWAYIHGYKKFGSHLGDFKGMYNVCCGHLHLGASKFVNFGGVIRQELNAGFFGDKNHTALSYTAMKKFTNWTLGSAEIDERGGRFCPIDE